MSPRCAHRSTYAVQTTRCAARHFLRHRRRDAHQRSEPVDCRLDLRRQTPSRDGRRWIIAEDARTPFDLVNGPAARVPTACASHPISMSSCSPRHHIICDGWSINVLCERAGGDLSGIVPRRDAAAAPRCASAPMHASQRKARSAEAGEDRTLLARSVREPRADAGSAHRPPAPGPEILQRREPLPPHRRQPVSGA